MSRLFCLFLLCLTPLFSWGQGGFPSSASTGFSLSLEEESASFSTPGLVLSSTAIVLGTASHYIPALDRLNIQADEALWATPHDKFPIDNYLQYSPLAASYLLKLCGVPSRHDWKTMTFLSATSLLTMAVVVQIPKQTTHILRPDGRNDNSFPSGHTATAFATAEILRLEYHEVSPWIGVAGYAAAATTGFLRMYNRRHWAGDVLAGAGIGFLSTHLNYWLYDRWKSRQKPVSCLSINTPLL